MSKQLSTAGNTVAESVIVRGKSTAGNKSTLRSFNVFGGYQ